MSNVAWGLIAGLSLKYWLVGLHSFGKSTYGSSQTLVALVVIVIVAITSLVIGIEFNYDVVVVASSVVVMELLLWCYLRHITGYLKWYVLLADHDKFTHRQWSWIVHYLITSLYCFSLIVLGLIV